MKNIDTQTAQHFRGLLVFLAWRETYGKDEFLFRDRWYLCKIAQFFYLYAFRISIL